MDWCRLLFARGGETPAAIETRHPRSLVRSPCARTHTLAGPGFQACPHAIEQPCVTETAGADRSGAVRGRTRTVPGPASHLRPRRRRLPPRTVGPNGPALLPVGAGSSGGPPDRLSPSSSTVGLGDWKGGGDEGQEGDAGRGSRTGDRRVHAVHGAAVKCHDEVSRSSAGRARTVAGS